jgi:hypothetical protein
MRSVRLVVAVSAAMLVSAGVAVAPASSAEPSKGSGLHACAGKPITVVSGTKVDGKKVNAGTYSLTVEGMSCKRARQVIGLAIDRDEIIREVYELTTDRPGDGVALELVDDQGTDKAADDRRLRLVEAVGSTVNIVNAAERAFTVGVLRGSGTTGSVAAQAWMCRWRSSSVPVLSRPSHRGWRRAAGRQAVGRWGCTTCSRHACSRPWRSGSSSYARHPGRRSRSRESTTTRRRGRDRPTATSTT